MRIGMVLLCFPIAFSVCNFAETARFSCARHLTLCPNAPSVTPIPKQSAPILIPWPMSTKPYGELCHATASPSTCRTTPPRSPNTSATTKKSARNPRQPLRLRRHQYGDLPARHRMFMIMDVGPDFSFEKKAAMDAATQGPRVGSPDGQVQAVPQAPTRPPLAAHGKGLRPRKAVTAVSRLHARRREQHEVPKPPGPHEVLTSSSRSCTCRCLSAASSPPAAMRQKRRLHQDRHVRRA